MKENGNDNNSKNGSKKIECGLYIHNIASLVTCANPSKKPKTGGELLDAGEIKNGAVLTGGGKIIKAGAAAEIEKYISDNKITPARDIDACGKTVMPGFVDPHTHMVFSGSRENEFAMRVEGKSYLEILKAGGGILNTLKSMRTITEDELYRESSGRVLSAFMHGTTSMEIKSGYGLDFDAEIKTLKVCRRLAEESPCGIEATFLGAHAIPPEYKDRRGEYIDLIINKVLPYVAGHKLARFNDVFVEEGAFTADEGLKILEAGKKLGLIPKVHADEITCCGGAELAAAVGAISADHLLMASERGLEMMKERGVIAVALPGTLYSLLSKNYLNFERLMKTGVAPALATDANPGSNMCINMQTALNQAVCLMKVPPAAAINMATINAAHSIGIAGRCGSIEEGKQADLIVIDGASYNYIAYSYGVNHVKCVIKNGVPYHVESALRKL
jgi:imidazolonepropionase